MITSRNMVRVKAAMGSNELVARQGDDDDRHDQQPEIRSSRKREEERDPEDDEAEGESQGGLESARGDEQTREQGHQEHQVSAKGIRFARLPLEGSGHPINARYLEAGINRDQDTGKKDDPDETPDLLFGGDEVHHREIDENVLDVLQHEQEPDHRPDPVEEHPDRRAHHRHKQIRHDRPVQGRTEEESEFLVYRSPGEPCEGDDEDKEIINPQGYSARAGSAAREISDEKLGTQQHGEDEDIESHLRPEETYEKDQDTEGDGQPDDIVGARDGLGRDDTQHSNHHRQSDADYTIVSGEGCHIRLMEREVSPDGSVPG